MTIRRLTDSQIDALTERAVRAALAEIDATLPTASRSVAPCGDGLAAELDRAIRSAVTRQLAEYVELVA